MKLHLMVAKEPSENNRQPSPLNFLQGCFKTRG